MRNQLFKVLAILFAVAVIAAACGSSDDEASGDSTGTTAAAGDDTTTVAGDEDEGATTTAATEEERTASDIGVTEDTIKIGVLVSDLDPLIESGFSLPAALSTAHLADRTLLSFADWNAEGGINGRMVEGVPLVWDPLDSSTMQDTCTQGTLDNELFAVVNGNGYNTSFIPCFTEDNDVFFLFGETVSQAQIDRSPNRLFALNPPAEIAGEVGAQAAIDSGLIPEGAIVGILSASDSEGIQVAGEATRAVLEENGFGVELIEVATLDVDPAVTNAETASAVSEFTAAGVGHVFVLMGFTTAAGFWNELKEAAPAWDTTIIDSSSSMCTPFGASRLPAADGAICISTYDTNSLPGGTSLRGDTESEAACRADWIRHFSDTFNGKSDPGVPSGEAPLVTADGEELYSDFQSADCINMNILKEALTNAGINPTRDSLADAMREISGPMAHRSNDFGTFGPNKNYFATAMHPLIFRVTPADTPRGADGTFNGCAAPVNCWIPATDEWTPLPE